MSAPAGRAGALAQRLAALLCLVAAALFGLTALVASRFASPGGDTRLHLPGNAQLDPAAVTVLLVCTAIAALCGLGVLVFPALMPLAQRPRSSRRRPVLIMALGGAALVSALALRHYMH